MLFVFFGILVVVKFFFLFVFWDVYRGSCGDWCGCFVGLDL